MVENMRACHSCARSIDERLFPFGLAYCPYCGDTLPPPDRGDELHYCPYCGLEQSCPADFCPHCGKKLAFNMEAGRGKPLTPAQPAHPLKKQPVVEPVVCDSEEYESADYAGYGSGYAPMYRPKTQPFEALGRAAVLVWGKVSGFVREFISGQYRIKRLYRHWTAHSALPEDAVPSGEALAQITRESGAATYRPLRISLVVLAVVGLLLVFIGVGFIIKSC